MRRQHRPVISRCDDDRRIASPGVMTSESGALAVGKRCGATAIYQRIGQCAGAGHCIIVFGMRKSNRLDQRLHCGDRQAGIGARRGERDDKIVAINAVPQTACVDIGDRHVAVGHHTSPAVVANHTSTGAIVLDRQLVIRDGRKGVVYGQRTAAEIGTVVGQINVAKRDTAVNHHWQDIGAAGRITFGEGCAAA